APVGDRYVVERMRAEGKNVGGEPSGHIILSDISTTGDGLVAALQVLAEIRSRDCRASQALRRFDPVPQTLVTVKRPKAALNANAVQSAIESGTEKLNGQGRLLIRPSGTEPVIRVMAEGRDERLVAQVVAEIVAAIESV